MIEIKKGQWIWKVRLSDKVESAKTKESEGLNLVFNFESNYFLITRCVSTQSPTSIVYVALFYILDNFWMCSHNTEKKITCKLSPVNKKNEKYKKIVCAKHINLLFNNQ